MADKAPREFRTRAPRRTPEQMAEQRQVKANGEALRDQKATQAAVATVVIAPGTKQIDAVSADVIQEMRIRARDRALAEQAEAKDSTAKFAAQLAPKKWLYNSNIENISEFHESYLIVDDGYFEYTPPANFPFSDDDKDTHLEFCRSRVNTKPIDGVANAKRIRTASEELIAQTQFMPPQPSAARDDALTIETVV